MSIISHRACDIIGVNDDKIERFVMEVKDYLVEAGIPDTYSVNIYKDEITCCGHIPIGIAVEIEGPKIQPIKNLDEKILGKIKEICGREHVDYYECSPVEILQNIKGEVFKQGE